MNYMKISKPKKKSCINDFNEFIKNLKNEKKAINLNNIFFHDFP